MTGVERTACYRGLAVGKEMSQLRFKAAIGQLIFETSPSLDILE